MIIRLDASVVIPVLMIATAEYDDVTANIAILLPVDINVAVVTVAIVVSDGTTFDGGGGASVVVVVGRAATIVDGG